MIKFFNALNRKIEYISKESENTLNIKVSLSRDELVDLLDYSSELSVLEKVHALFAGQYELLEDHKQTLFEIELVEDADIEKNEELMITDNDIVELFSTVVVDYAKQFTPQIHLVKTLSAAMESKLLATQLSLDMLVVRHIVTKPIQIYITKIHKETDSAEVFTLV